MKVECGYFCHLIRSVLCRSVKVAREREKEREGERERERERERVGNFMA